MQSAKRSRDRKKDETVAMHEKIRENSDRIERLEKSLEDLKASADRRKRKSAQAAERRAKKKDGKDKTPPPPPPPAGGSSGAGPSSRIYGDPF